MASLVHRNTSNYLPCFLQVVSLTAKERALLFKLLHTTKSHLSSEKENISVIGRQVQNEANTECTDVCANSLSKRVRNRKRSIGFSLGSLGYMIHASSIAVMQIIDKDIVYSSFRRSEIEDRE
jgi:hypothetical protein